MRDTNCVALSGIHAAPPITLEPPTSHVEKPTRMTRRSDKVGSDFDDHRLCPPLSLRFECYLLLWVLARPIKCFMIHIFSYCVVHRHYNVAVFILVWILCYNGTAALYSFVLPENPEYCNLEGSESY